MISYSPHPKLELWESEITNLSNRQCNVLIRKHRTIILDYMFFTVIRHHQSLIGLVFQVNHLTAYFVSAPRLMPCCTPSAPWSQIRNTLFSPFKNRNPLPFYGNIMVIDVKTITTNFCGQESLAFYKLTSSFRKQRVVQK